MEKIRHLCTVPTLVREENRKKIVKLKLIDGNLNFIDGNL